MTFIQTSNQTGKNTTAFEDDWPLAWNDYLWTGVAILCVCIGLVGNLTLIYIILRNDSMRNTRNLLICNIALGDLLLIVSFPTYTFTFVFPSFQIKWTNVLCKFFRTWLSISQGISVFSLTWLSVERYQAFSTTQRGFVSRYVTVISVCIWISAIVLTLPLIIYTKASVYNFNCNKFPDNEMTEKMYALFQFTALYAIPLFVILVHYCLIINILIKSMKLMPAQTSNREDQIRRRKRSSMVLSLITLLFAVCWLPYFIQNLLLQFSSNDEMLFSMRMLRFKQFSEIMVYISACINPVTLFLISKRHRHYFRKYLCCGSQRSREITTGLFSNARSFFGNVTSKTQTGDLHLNSIEQFTKSEYSCVKQEET